MWRFASSIAIAALAGCGGGAGGPELAVCGRGDVDRLASSVSDLEIRFLDDAGQPIGETVTTSASGGHVDADIPPDAVSFEVSGLDESGAPIAGGSGEVSAGCACFALSQQAVTACSGLTCELVADSCRFSDETGSAVGAQTVRWGEGPDDDIHGVTSDTFLQEDEPDSPHDGITLEAGPTPLRVALVRFDLAALPAAATIESARLWLRVCDDGNCDSSHTFEVHEVLEEWSEAATWNDRVPGTAWAAAGCGAGSCDAPSVGSLVAPDVEGAALPIDLDLAPIAGWAADAASNDGVAITGQGDSGTAVHFDSSETATAPPSLEITYRL